MPVYLGIIGLVVLLIVFYDFFTTTLATAHSGPLSLMVIRACKLGSTYVFRHFFRNRLLLSAIGPLTVVSILLMWFIVTWVAWVFIFFSTSGAVVRSSDSSEADIAQRVYYVGYVITTLGMGDFIPATNFFRLMTSAMSILGFLQFALAATWLLNISQAVSSTRMLATQIASAGYNPAQLLINAWDGETFSSLTSFLSNISSALAARAQQEIYMPVLTNFHPYERDAAEGIQIPVVDEALTLLLFAIEDPASKGIDKFTLIHTRNVITKLLENAMHRPFVRPSRKTPPVPDLHHVQLADIPIIEDKEYLTRMQRIDVLARFVEECGYSWQEVWHHRQEAKKSSLEILREQFPFFDKWASRDRELPVASSAGV